MKSCLLGVAFALCFSLTMQDPASAVPPQAQKPLWYTDYERAKELARQQDKPLFVVFR